MKVYVGAPLSHWQDAARAMSALRSMGHEITHDWTLGAEAYFAGQRDEKNAEIAVKCIDGVAACDRALFLIDTTTPMQGTWSEFGAALALGKPVDVYLDCLIAAENDWSALVDWYLRAAFLSHPLVKLSSSYASTIRRFDPTNQPKENAK